MLMPRKVKYRKQQRGRMSGKAKGGSDVTFGDFGIQALEPAWLTARQIEAARIAMTRHVKRGGKVWIRVFPDKPITKKPAETRMGKGKGSPEMWVAVVRPGRVMFELEGVTREIAEKGVDGSDAIAVEALRVFCGWLGSIVGNLVLLYGAQGGVHLAGGILPQISKFLIGSDFTARFRDKGAMRKVLEHLGR